MVPSLVERRHVCPCISLVKTCTDKGEIKGRILCQLGQILLGEPRRSRCTTARCRLREWGKSGFTPARVTGLKSRNTPRVLPRLGYSFRIPSPGKCGADSSCGTAHTGAGSAPRPATWRIRATLRAKGTAGTRHLAPFSPLPYLRVLRVSRLVLQPGVQSLWRPKTRLFPRKLGNLVRPAGLDSGGGTRGNPS